MSYLSLIQTRIYVPWVVVKKVQPLSRAGPVV